MRLQPKDVIAVVAISGIFLLKLRGVNGGLDTAAALIIGYYFGHRVSKIDNGS